MKVRWYHCEVKEIKKTKKELTRNQSIKTLMTKTKRLLNRYLKIKKELNYYEETYEQALKSRIKLMKMHMQEDKLKLNVLKQRCNELDTHMGFKPLDRKRTKEQHSERRSKMSKTIKKMKPKFKQKNSPINEKIKIKIMKNKKLGNHKIFFINDDNVQHTFINPIKVTEPETLNFRECRIELERISDKQAEQYIRRKCIDQHCTKKEQTSQKILQNINKNELRKINQNWHTKIPKSILEQIQTNQNFDFIENTNLTKVV
ncbi:uncharacterized protein LOC143149710 isoform X2 [Ptiloglossa arizonensis]|uniref:uncharacterized protein LOC143149710 isoform X2 n=1 Tax=Ptiloglossa arizonensis TaxID=3350558 RepID=UPI003FA007DD